MMDYAHWIDHVVECLESRVMDTDEEARIYERGLPGVYYDVVWAEYHDDVRNTGPLASTDTAGLARCSRSVASTRSTGPTTTAWSATGSSWRGRSDSSARTCASSVVLADTRRNT